MYIGDPLTILTLIMEISVELKYTMKTTIDEIAFCKTLVHRRIERRFMPHNQNITITKSMTGDNLCDR